MDHALYKIGVPDVLFNFPNEGAADDGAICFLPHRLHMFRLRNSKSDSYWDFSKPSKFLKALLGADDPGSQPSDWMVNSSGSIALYTGTSFSSLPSTSLP